MELLIGFEEKADEEAADGAVGEGAEREVVGLARSCTATDQEDDQGLLELEDVVEVEQPPFPPYWIYTYSSK